MEIYIWHEIFESFIWWFTMFSGSCQAEFDHPWVRQLWWLLSVHASAQQFMKYVNWAYPLEVIWWNPLKIVLKWEKNRYKNVLSIVITIVKLPHKSRFLIGFFMDVRAKGHMVLFNFFPPFRLTPAVTITHQTLATKITKQFSVFSNFEKNEVFFPLYQTRIHVAAK